MMGLGVPILRATLAAMAAASLLAAAGCEPRAFDASLRKAEAAVGLGEYDRALLEYRGLAREHPSDPRRPDLLLRIAALYDSALGDGEAGLRSYADIIREYPLSGASIRARERRAEMLQARGDHDGAVAHYSELLKYFPDDEGRHRWRLLIAAAYLASRNFVQARMEVRPLIGGGEIPPDVREQALFVAGESFFLAGWPKEAAPHYQQMLKDFPASPLAGEAELHLATCVEEMGYLGLARDIAKDAGRDYPNRRVIAARLKSMEERGGSDRDKKAATGRAD